MVLRSDRQTTTRRYGVRQRRLAAAVAGLKGTVRFNAPLKEYTSFRIGGPADVLVEPADVADVRRLVIQTRDQDLPIFVLGGTNLLIRDKGVRGVVISLRKLRTIKEEPDSVLYAEGGVGMPTLIGYAIRRSLAGLEWAARIPRHRGRMCRHERGHEARGNERRVKGRPHRDPGRHRGGMPGGYHSVHLPAGAAAARRRGGCVAPAETGPTIGN